MVNSLTGPIPPELGNLEQLQYLYLDNNTLTGLIPPEFGNLAQIRILELWRNSLTGPIPPELGNLPQLVNLMLSHNSLTGSIPHELGKLTQLEWLHLQDNSLTGTIPSELGNLAHLTQLHLSSNSLTGPVPPELGNLTQLQELRLQSNTLTGALPRSLMQLHSLRTLHFGGQQLCAPRDNEFQTWLRSIPEVDGPTCAGIQFAGTIADQSFPRAQQIAPLVLPEAAGGVEPINYTLTPTMLAGLSFDASARTISGTPTEVTAAPVPYTYTATDAYGSTDSLQFNIEVYSPVAIEDETVPESFAVHGNYPNPFRQSTRIVFDLPWPARVTVEVIDVTGRRVLAIPPEDLAAGWKQDIELRGGPLPSGFYLYRLMATSPEGHSTHVSPIMRIR
ncbi:MAG: T9SS type A sorting domain-containing protein [Rhodothermaceae bacterium]|nr:T9SS type A sorting domain-containing protein [Rhodothermaceae bacterium]